MQLWQTNTLQEITLVRGQGCIVWDTTGNPYLDLLDGTWCNILGHRHSRWVEAVQSQVAKQTHVGAPFPTEEVGEALSKMGEKDGFGESHRLRTSPGQHCRTGTSGSYPMG
jgi:acetylornithine aminotransferase